MSSRVFSTRHPGRMFALFRHPVDRAVSMYHYLAKASWDPHYNPALSKMTIEQYAKSGYIENNWMTRFLANRPGGKLAREDMLLAKTIVESKCLVGLYEDIEVSLARFARFFGWERPKDNSTAARSAADVVRCRSEAVARGDGHVSGKPSGDNGVMSTVRPGSLAWNAIVRMNAFDMELYEYAKRVYQTQAEEIFDVVGYELPSSVVASAAAGIGNVARSKSMNDGSTASASSQHGKREEFESLDEDRRADGQGGGSVAAAADFGPATNVAKDANEVKSMEKGAAVAKGAVKSMAKDFVQERVDESTFAGAGDKVGGDAFKVGIPALRMGDVVGAESEPVPTAKKMTLDTGGML
ncbi:hypothetical protein ACHAW5_009137 [Stephanodiscus triporus]|uniref:Sulfotransferase domain-containing protein n=1 Tax=Stephanodiscus triporus TaxID=2934178 RepID=A0ABD3QIH0_9STRA